jgi:hypothetical protein
MDGGKSRGQWGVQIPYASGDRRLHWHPSPGRMRDDAVGLAFAQPHRAAPGVSRAAASAQSSSQRGVSR